MKINLLLLAYSTALATIHVLSVAIEIRPAKSDDLNQLCAFDYLVSMEYFVPFYKQHFSHIDLGQHPINYLEEELKSDTKLFETLLTLPTQRSIIIAQDTAAQTIVGFILFHQNNDASAELDLLLVDSSYRKKGIGSLLVSAMLRALHPITYCDVYPFKEDTAYTFYEKMGFVRLGFGPDDRINSYGLRYSEAYFHYRLYHNSTCYEPNTSISGLNANH